MADEMVQVGRVSRGVGLTQCIAGQMLKTISQKTSTSGQRQCNELRPALVHLSVLQGVPDTFV